MQVRWAGEYATRQNLEQVEELVKRRWKTLLVLMVLALRAKTRVPVEAETAGVEKPVSPVAVAKVLLIDTDPASSKELAAVLANAGFEVLTALDPEEGVSRVKEASMVILDDELSRSEEMCSRIREQSNAPIILMGSEPDGKAWSRAVALGADAYLRKTINRRELVARMRTILRRYRASMYSEGELNNV